MKPVPINCQRWAALVRLSCPQGADLTTILHELARRSEAMEVRGCNPCTSFGNIYFAEVADKGSGRAETEWRVIVEEGIRRTRRTATDTCLLGVYLLDCPPNETLGR